MSPVWISNLTLAVIVIGTLFAARAVSRNRIWREACRELWRRRPVAISVVSIYLIIGGADALVWISGSSSTSSRSDTVAAYEPKSIIDVIFDDMKETTYSAPLAKTEFLGKAPLKHPGKHLLGTDVLGRDVLYMTIKGVRKALLLGGITTLLVIPIALLFGVSAGFWGGIIDDIVLFVMQTLATIPGLLLLIAIIMALGRGTLQVCLALAVTSWVGFCRLSRAETLKLREMDYVEAARALGVSNIRIVWRHIIPNLSHLIIITFTLFFCTRILSETALAYLGIGIDGSWGQMIDQARNELSRDPVIWWNLAGAAGALLILILAVNLIGDAARDVLDPRTLKEKE
jgi:peptide/nickel transport system permease protein